jgi:hypothetical protein
MTNIVPIMLIASFHIETNCLRVHYTVECKSEAPVYVVNHLTRYEASRGWMPDRSVAYVIITNSCEIEICKRVPPVADRLVTPRNYYVTQINPNQRLEEEISLPLPLFEHRPYDSFVGTPPPPKRVSARVRFCLGYFVAQRFLRIEPVSVHGVDAFRLVRNPAKATETAGSSVPTGETLIRSEPVEIELPVVALPTKGDLTLPQGR